MSKQSYSGEMIRKNKKVYCDENKTPLFAFNGYSKIETV